MRWRHGRPIAAFFCLLLMACSGENDAETAANYQAPAYATPRHIELSIQDQHISRDDNVIRVLQGDVIELAWTADKAVTLHLHGYDIELSVMPHTPGIMAFTARATGRFAITQHGSLGHQTDHEHETLAYLEVYPR